MYLYNIIYVDSIIYKYMLCDLATIRLWNIDFMARKGQNMQVLIYAKGSILPNHNPWESHVINPHKFGLLDWINSSVQNEGYFSSGYLCNIMIYKVYVLECGHYIHIHNIYIYIYSIGDIYIYTAFCNTKLPVSNSIQQNPRDQLELPLHQRLILLLHWQMTLKNHL